MPFVYNVPFFSILLAIVGAVVTPFLRRGETACHLMRFTQGAVAVLSAALLTEIGPQGVSFVYQMGHFPAPWGNELRAGPLEALLALVFSVVMLLSFTGGGEDLLRDIQPQRQGGFCLQMQLLFAALLALIYTNDLFTAYVFLEISAITGCAAVVARDTGRAVVSAIRYLIFSCLGSGLFLLGAAVLYGITGQLLMSSLAQSIDGLRATGAYNLPLTAAGLLMALGLAIKSAQFPFHAWLPDAHASATASASAVLSGLVLKGYIVLLLKLIVRVFGADELVDSHMADLLFLLGFSGMLLASLAALRQEEVKRMIAYSSSAQISYIFLALGLGTRAGFEAAVLQILAHAVTKSMIFVGAGGLIRVSGGNHHWGALRGAAWRAPISGLAFTIGGLSLCGLPLLAGFSSKLVLAEAAMDGSWHTAPALIAVAVSSVLNAMYYLPAVLAIWSDRQGQGRLSGGEHWQSAAAFGGFLACNLALGTGAGGVMALIREGLALFS